MKPEHKKKVKSAAPYIIAGIIIILLVIFVAAKNRRGEDGMTAAMPLVMSDTSSMSAATDAATAMPVAKTSVETQVQSASSTSSVPEADSMVASVSASPSTASNDKVNNGTFSVWFNVVAKAQDIYVSPTCQSIDAPATDDGVTFTMFQDGISMTEDNLGKGSCIVLNHGLSTQTSSGRYLVKAGTQNPFQLIVVDHPLESGNYAVGIDQIGYSLSDTAATDLLQISSYDKSRMKTTTLSL